MIGNAKGNTVAAVLAAGLAFAASAGSAQAQGFPTRPVTLIVPWPAGGTTDVGMRALASATEKHLGQSIMIENRPGGSGTLGPSQMAATEKPDGHIVAQIPITVFRFPFMQKTSFDPATDFNRAGRRVLPGIGEQINKYLAEPRAVCQERWKLGRQFQANFTIPQIHGAQRLADKFSNGYGCQVQFEGARF